MHKLNAASQCAAALLVYLLSVASLLHCSFVTASGAGNLTSGVTVIGSGATLPQQLYLELTNAYKVVQVDQSFQASSAASIWSPNRDDTQDTGTVTVQYTGTGSGAGQSAIKANQVDFAGSDSLLVDADYVAYPDLQMYPTVAAAVVLIYNIPALLSSDELVLTRSSLAKIFLGDIRQWNDQSILESNPTLATRLPNEAIVPVVRADKSGTTEIFTTGLSSFDTTGSNQTRFGSRIGVSSTPDWCELRVDGQNMKQVAYGNGFGASSTITCRKASQSNVPLNYLAGFKEEGVAALVRGTPNSIGYLVLNEAITTGLPFTSMINRAGNQVRANDESVSFAVLQNAGDLNDRMNLQLIDSTSRFAWPLVGATYIIIRQRTSPALCATRKALVKFWRWFYESTAADQVAVSLGFTPMPSQIRKRLANLLVTGVKCCTSSSNTTNCTLSAYVPEEKPALVIAKGDDVTLGMLKSIGYMQHAVTTLALPPLYISNLKQQSESQLISSAVSASDQRWNLLSRLDAYQSQLAEDQQLQQQLGGNEPHAGVFLHSLRETSIAPDATKGTGYVTLPLFAMGVGPLFHASAIDTDPTTRTSLYRQVVLTGEALASIYTGSIATWDHKTIKALNPHLFSDSTLASSLADKPIKVLLLVNDSMVNYVYSEYLSSVSEDFKSQIGIRTSFSVLMGRLGQRAVPVQSSLEMKKYLTINDFAIGYDTGYTSSTTEQPFGIGILPSSLSAVSAATYASSDSLTSCLNPDVGGQIVMLGNQTSILNKAISASSSSSTPCWPIVLSGALTIQSQWTGDACAVGWALAKYAEWLFLDNVPAIASAKYGALTATSSGSLLLAPPSRDGDISPNITSYLIDRLSTIQCNGNSILHPLPACTMSMMEYTISSCDFATLKRTVSFKFKKQNMCKGGASLPEDYTITCDNLPFFSSMGILTQVLAVIGVLYSFGNIFWTYRHRHAKVIVHAQKEFQLLFGLGCSGLHITMLAFLGQNDSFSCIIRPWAFSLVSTIAYVPLIAKLHRLHKVFTAVLKRVVISNWALMRRILGLVMVDVFLLALWSIIHAPTFEQRPIQVAGMDERQASAYRSDLSSDSPLSYEYYDVVCTTTSSPFFWILAGWKCLLIIFGVVVTIRAWKLDEKYSDARWLGVIIYNTFMMSALCLLLIFVLIKDDGALQTLIICITLFLVAALSVTLQTAPKIYRYYKDSDAKQSTMTGPRSSLS